MRDACRRFLMQYKIEQEKMYDKSKVSLTAGIVEYNANILVDIPKVFADHVFKAFPYEHFLWDLWEKARIFKNKNGWNDVPMEVITNSINRLRHQMLYGTNESMFDNIPAYFYGIMTKELEWYRKTAASEQKQERELWERAERRSEEREPLGAYQRMKYEQYYGSSIVDDDCE